jgi:uncharacterized protein (TIGR03083 family)
MTHHPRRWVCALRSAHERLLLIVNSFTLDALSLPTYTEGETIAQLLSHLGYGAEMGLADIRAAALGLPVPGRDALEASREAWLNRAPEELASGFVAADERYIRFLESMTDDDLAALRIFLYIREVGLAPIIRARLGELAVHAWDIEVMREPATLVAAEAVELLVRDLAELPPWFGRPQGRKFRAHVTTESPECHYVIDVNKRVIITAGEPAGSVDGHLIMPAEALVRLTFARLDPERCPDTKGFGKVSLGDLCAVFPGG